MIVAFKFSKVSQLIYFVVVCERDEYLKYLVVEDDVKGIHR